MAFLAALPEVAEAGGAEAGAGAAGGSGMLSRLPVVGKFLGGGGSHQPKPTPESAEALAHETLGNLNRAQFG